MTDGNNPASPGGSGRPRVATFSLGCRTNQEEMSSLEAALRRGGFGIVDDHGSADIVVVNTCSVTGRTESKVRRFLSALSRAAPHAEILVTGCMAQQKAGALSRVRGVSWVVGNAGKQEIPAIIRGGGRGIFVSEPDRRPLVVPPHAGCPAPGGRTRLLVKIQEGCDRRCSYCIVPLLRGPARSAPLSDVIDLCASAVRNGFKELVLTGTHIGQYHSSGGEGLLPLVGRLLAIDGDFRVRLSSLDPAEISDELLALAGAGGRLCDHLHFSLQSLSPEVLAAMGRPCKKFDALLERLIAFRRRYPHAGLGADFIVGFPGETEAQFGETVTNAEKIGFSYAHIFRFSPRPGTAAALLPGAVPETAKRERGRRFAEAIERSSTLFFQREQGQARRIIVEQERPARGVTGNYLDVEIPACSASHNAWLDVIIEGKLKGRRCCARPLSAGKRP